MLRGDAPLTRFKDSFPLGPRCISLTHQIARKDLNQIRADLNARV
jgi:hypothetical protein